METLVHDARHALRALLKAPGFTVVAVITMAIAIGANATVFSFVNALLLEPPAAVAAPSTLLSIYTSDFSSGRYGSSSYPDFETIREGATALSDVAASREQAATLVRVGDSTERVHTLSVTGNYFALLGVRPIHGRSILPADTRAGAEPVLLISERFWRRALGGEMQALGSSVRVGGAPHIIVGVVPAEFTGLNIGVAVDLWTPMPPRSEPSARGSRELAVIARLAADADLTQAQAQLDSIASRLAQVYPETNRGTLAAPDAARPIRVVGLTRMHPNFRAQVAMISSVLLAAVTLVLLIACANVAGLQLSRSTARRRDVALRLALGASRWRLVRQMMTESLILGLAGGAAGLLVALWTADSLPSFFPAEQARLLDAGVDPAVLGFTAFLSIMSGLIFGVVPAIQGWRAAPSGALRADANRAGDTRGSLVIRKGLVVGQVALASVLLVSAVLLTRSLSNALAADLGFSTREAVLSEMELPPDAGPASRGYFDAVLAQVRALPGIESVAFARFVPVAGTSRRGFAMDGYTPREGEDTELHFNVVSAGFFETMGIAASAGRVFTEADRTGAPAVVVNQTFADRYYEGNAVGRRIVDGFDRPHQIVGVVRAERRLDLQDPPLPVVFHLLDQQQPTRRMILVARTAGPPESAVDTVRRTAAAVDRNAAVFRTLTLRDHLDEALAANQLTVALMMGCGVMALVLALVGIYGVVSYMVVRRTREIGVRVALGATPVQVLRLLVAEHGGMVGLGLVIGVIAAAGASRLLGSMLYAVSANDPATYAGVLVAVALVSALACIFPASRALGVSPVTALRHE